MYGPSHFCESATRNAAILADSVGICSSGQSAAWLKNLRKIIQVVLVPNGYCLLVFYPMLLCENIQADLKLSISHGNMVV